MFAACPFVPPSAAAVRRVAAPYKGIAESTKIAIDFCSLYDNILVGD